MASTAAAAAVPVRRAVISATLANVLASLPSFLVGASAVFVREDLGFDERALGLAIAGYYGTSALLSVFGGRSSDVIGPYRAVLLSTAGSTVALLAIGLFAATWWHLAVFLLIGGAAHSLSQPAANLALARSVPRNRQGLAFGFKQAAIPLATLIAGLSVPLVALTIGWRWSFLMAAGAAMLVPILSPRLMGAESVDVAEGDADSPRGPLVLLAAAAALGSAAAICLGAFLIESIVARGIGAGVGGVILAVSSVIGIASRFTTGWRADFRDGGNLAVVATMMAGGTVGYLLLSTGTTPVTVGIGAVIAFGAGWGWPALYMYTVVRLNPISPGIASGIAQAGAMIGALVGPLVFGILVSSFSYQVAWTVAAASTGTASVLVVTARAWIVRQRAAGRA